MEAPKWCCNTKPIAGPTAWSRNRVDSSKSFFPTDTINPAAFASGAFQRLRELKALGFAWSFANSAEQNRIALAAQDTRSP